MATATFTTATEQWLDGTGGRIFTRHWEPVGTAKANLVICHGVNSHGGQYIRAAEEFASRGFAVTALDCRRGKSDCERFYATIADYVLRPQPGDRAVRSPTPTALSCSSTAPAA